MKKRRRKSAIHTAVAAGAVTASFLPVWPLPAAQATTGVTFIPLDTSAYGVNDLNSVGIIRDNLATVGNYQYTAYYDYVNSSTATIEVGRRALNSSTWSLVTTPYTVSIGTNGVAADSIIGTAIDDHDVVAMAVDGNGDMHLSWGMHNVALNYAISSPVNGSTFSPVFTTQTPTNNPNLFAEFTSTGVSQATYPEFYYTPSSSGAPSGNLLFDIREAASASGGGSGNGNTYFSVFNASTGFAAPTEVLNGGQTSVNGYQNNLVYDHAGNLLYSWTWRETPNYQSNAYILFAQSSTNSASWTQQGGATPYTLPIIASTANGGTAAQVAQVVEPLPQNSSLINTTGMTVDASNNPIIATWYTPNGTASQAVSGTNNPNRQYMLVYYTGTQWKTSQITNRTTDTSFDTSGNDVRDLGRPLVMVDPQGRVLVVTRSDNSMGGFTNSGGSGNNIVVYWNTIASLDSASPNAWQPIALDTANMGEYEPTMDYNLWASSSILDLFYEPSGFTGQTTGTAQLLQWNEQAYFAVATPASLFWDPNPAAGLQDGSGIWDATHTNFSDGTTNYAWNNNFATYATFGVNNGAAGVVTLGSNITLQSITFNASGSGNYNIAGGGYSLSFASTASIIANVNATISAPIIATGLGKTGAGILTLSGNNTITGTIQIGTGATAGGFVNGGLCITSAAAVNGTSTIYLVDNNSAYDLLQLNGSGGNISLPTSLTIELNADSAGPGGTGATILESVAGSNTIAGPLTLNVGGKGYGFAVDAGSLTFTGNQTLSSHILYLRGAGSGSFTGNLGGTGSIESDGPGIWTLGAIDSYTGSTNVSGGTLNLSAGASITSTTVSVTSGTLNAAGSLAAGTNLLVGGTVNFELGNNSGILTRTLASLNISSGGVVTIAQSPTHATRTLLVASSALINGTTNAWHGLIDLSNNDLLVHHGSLTNLTNQVDEGSNLSSGGNWNGSGGIASTAAAADSAHLTALGVIQNSINQSTTGAALYTTFDSATAVDTDVLVKFTYYGDSNLDGIVDGTDYSRIDNGFVNHSTGWFNGDFNYDGAVDGSDYTLIDNAFNSQGTQLTAKVANPTAIIADAGGAAVPEPGMLGTLAMGAACVLSRRRKQPRGCNIAPRPAI